MNELKAINNADSVFLICFKTDNKEYYEKVRALCDECMQENKEQ